MVFSYYLTKYPYKVVWNFLKLIGRTERVVFYCGNEIDVKIFEPVQKYLKPIPVVVKNKKIQARLKEMGIESKLLPSFSDAVITCRQAAYRFPKEKIIKFGFRHGAYHFKPFANSRSYNQYTKFFMTSANEVEAAQRKGISSGVAVGYPKLDAAFDGTYDERFLSELRDKNGMDPAKKVILFTATWDRSGISAVEKWYDRLDALCEKYNVLVTVHPSTSAKYLDVIKNTEGIHFISDNDVVPYIMLSDVCIGDSSSILAECCALKKSIITFKVPDGKRMVPEVKEIIRNISFRIDDFSELEEAIGYALAHPHEKDEPQERANVIMFDVLDGQAGKRAAEQIIELVPHLRK